jgi:RNA polymerase sigma factor (TIGR02999 family)
MSSSSSPITEILSRLRSGDRDALDDLVTVVYAELRSIARRQRRRDPRQDPTLATTALVNEAYIRLAQHDRGLYRHREHFLAVAATAMRQIVIDEARKRLRRKRGSGQQLLSLDERDIRIDDQAELLVSLNEALDGLDRVNPRLRQVVECRYFAGLTEEETAQALGVSSRTVRRDWAKARAWLVIEHGLAEPT